MSLFSGLRDKIGPRSFSRLCTCVGLLGFLVVLPALFFWKQEKALQGGKLPWNCDFSQYYAGAVVVREGIWDALYPVPRPDVYNQPPRFAPLYRTLLFDPAKMDHNRAFYPPVNLPSASDCVPALPNYFPEASEGFRYVYPPPTALLFWPLSWMSFKTAEEKVFPVICYGCFFLVALGSARIYRLLRGTVSYTEGLIMLTALLVNYRGNNSMGSGNSTPVIALLITGATYCLMKRRLLGFSCALIGMVLIKSIGLTWVPLVLIRREYRGALVYLAALSIILNGAVLWLAGFKVYLTFFSLLPLISIPVGEGLVPVVLGDFGYYPKTMLLLCNAAVLVLLYGAYWLRRRHRASDLAANHDHVRLLALLAGTIALYCLTNFTVWVHYIMPYLLLPFLGWVLLEGQRASRSWRWAIFGGALLSILVAGGEWIFISLAFHLFGTPGVDACLDDFCEPFIMIVIPLFFLALAIRRLVVDPPASLRPS